ncbi:hypothetical protein F4861DRAFT_539935 [Xylaria intraflava]|nr:hypothetical protein F4861DRAFT_539935 [Xylaria intraflava]
MDANDCQMEGSSIDSPQYRPEDPESYFHLWGSSGAHQYQNQINHDAQPQWSGSSGSRPAYGPDGEVAHTPSPNYLIHGGVIDDCYQARLYAKALELYLLENECPENPPYACPMSCTEQTFGSLKDMLRHLKTCPIFLKEAFSLPMCRHSESCKVRSGKWHVWDKHFGHIIQKSKNIFRSLTSHRSGTQKAAEDHELCPNRSVLSLSAEISRNARPASSGQVQPSQLTELPALSTEWQGAELDAGLDAGNLFYLYELPVAANPEYNPAQSQSQCGTVHDTECLVPMIPTASSGLPNSEPADISSTSSTSHNSAGDNTEDTFNGASSSTIEPSSEAAEHPTRSFLDMAPHSNDFSLISPAVDNFDPETFTSSSTSISPAARNSIPRNTPTLRVETSQVPGPTFLLPPDDDVPMMLPDDDVPMLSYEYEDLDEFVGAQYQKGMTLLDRTASSQTSLPNLSAQEYSSFVFDPESPVSMPSLTTNPSPITPLSIKTPASAAFPTTPLFDARSPLSSEKLKYKCPYCWFVPSGNPANYRAYLRKHVSTHGDKDIMLCHRCERPFTRRDNLMTHLKNIHSDFTPLSKRAHRRPKKQSQPKRKLDADESETQTI